MSHTSYDRHHPFVGTLVEKTCLNRPGSQKSTLHLVVQIPQSGITYKVGDSCGILPLNDPELVNRAIQAMGAKGDEMVVDKRSGQPFTLESFLLQKTNITRLSKNFLQFLTQKMAVGSKQEELTQILAHHETLSSYLSQFELWDILLEHSEIKVTAQEICDHLLPLLPRFYSIASAQCVVGEEVHFTVAMVEYTTRGIQRFGVASQFLGRQVPMSVPAIPLYHHPSHGFCLPEDGEADIIMIGPGTGIAPYRGFMQERVAKKATGRNWLFFGEQHRDFDYLYEDFWQELEAKEALRVTLAFSRDQAEKIYVQHRMYEHADELFAWLEKGAYFFVCGDAHHMAKDVEAMLLRIIQEQGKCSEEAARAYLKQLKHSKRYRRDVY